MQWFFPAVAALLAGAVAMPVGAQQLSQEAVAAQVADAYEVEVLKVSDADVAGRPAYEVIVMNPGGDFNAAFQVNTLLVDAATGQLIPAFQHERSGYALSGARSFTPEDEGNGLAMRRRSFRE